MGKIMNTKYQQGVTLVELMIALVLGILAIGAVLGVFLSNTQSFRTTENTARAQEGARGAFEMMSRQLREAPPFMCINAMQSDGDNWWDDINENLISATADNAITRVPGPGPGTDVLVTYTSSAVLDDPSQQLGRNCRPDTLMQDIAFYPVAWFVLCNDGTTNCDNRERSLHMAYIDSAGTQVNMPVVEGVAWMTVLRRRSDELLFSDLDMNNPLQVWQVAENKLFTANAGPVSVNNSGVSGNDDDPGAAIPIVAGVQLVAVEVTLGMVADQSRDDVDRVISYVINLRNRTL